MATAPHSRDEIRTATVTAEGLATEGRMLHGFAALYDTEAQLDGFVETIQRGAFTKALASDPDVYLTFNHSPDRVLARTSSGTLKLRDEERGLAFEAELGDGPTAQDVRSMVSRGDLSGASFRFKVAPDGERWNGERRTLTEIAQLIDVSLATTPAYAGPKVELRSTNNDNDAAPARQEEKMEQPEQQEPQEHAVEQHDDESRALPAGSLRVEERVEVASSDSLARVFEQRGFFENGVAQIGWDEYRGFTWAGGTVLDTLNPIRREGVGLGYDSRWLYPVLPTTAVSDATTSVQYLQQSSRTLAGTAVIRPLDSTTTKPETSSAAELQTLQLQQVATIQSNIPRIHGAQPLFQSLVENDLRYSISDGLDEVVRRGVNTAGTAAAVTGNIVDKVRKARTVVESNGYRPSVLAIDPAGAESLDLLKTSGSEAFYVFSPGQSAPGPWGLEMRIWKNTGTAILDADSFGRLFVSPTELRAFEQDAGASNRQTVRMECSAGFAVERLAAGLKIL